MSWKKNICSYLLWLVYTGAVSFGLIGFLGVGFGALGYLEEYSFLVIGIVYLLAGLLVFGLHKCAAKHRKTEASTNTVSVVVEGVILVVLLAVGIILRAGQMQYVTDSGSDAVYFEMAKIVAGNHVPQVVHGATYLYLELLHVLFLLLGNVYVAGVWLQVGLLSLACIFLYFAVRKLAGKIAALVMTGFLMLSPYMLNHTMLLTPEYLFLCIYALVLWLVAGVLKKNNCNPAVYLLTGCLIGVCCYFDLTGLTLLVVSASIFTVEREKAVRAWNKRGMAFLLQVLGVMAGWAITIILDAVLCGKEMVSVLTDWLHLYQPDNFGALPSEWLLSGNLYVGLGHIALYVVLVVGIFSFWCRKKQERQGIWMGMALVLVLLICFQMLTSHITGVTYLYWCLTVLAGVSVADIFAGNPVREEKKIVENEEAKQTNNNTQDDMVDYDAEQEPAEEKNEDGVQKVQLLENPLPLPKKHVHKVMDYRIKDFSEGDFSENDFDFDVAENDDFDI